ncbi:uncharacterized protein MYCFIDRAFT_70601 [Pseudocercospora fijiensis CIRAD86]|uniref:J domain-containing protein n=1 Tax=Pseudocercospora fijiensis (strain CIRAD86) TaxID=383855 RepID=M3AS24_PSEFD|nr:uncharacterized protein MYCFIDRAFT_70601 [Pseudocercospora fijiensis CIRAD86]EME80252.1 hypothetical protein MYCFIDRAFT_70601 [Pseudocercospora fijiensis CIRAD86]
MLGIHRAALLLVVTLAATAAAWSKEDHEIFRLHDEVTKSEGADATFYSWLGISPNAKQDEINRAYRKLSRTIHPDKATSNWIANYNKPPPVVRNTGAKPTVHVQKNKQPSKSQVEKVRKEAQSRFERLSLVANVLRGPERERYDHFLKNGFPIWRGTGYYYERFRPGFGTVLTGLFLFGAGGVHYAFLYLTWKQQRDFVNRYIKHARRMAWGDESGIGAIPGLGGPVAQSPNRNVEDSDESMTWNRKQKREMERQKKKDGKNPVKASRAAAAKKARESGVSTPVESEITPGPVGAKKRTVAENGKVLIVDSVGNVWLEDETEEGDVQEFLLDPDEVPMPTLFDTGIVRIPKYLYNVSLGKVLNKQTSDHVAAELVGEEEEVDATEAVLQSATAPNANGEARKRKTKNKS